MKFETAYVAMKNGCNVKRSSWKMYRWYIGKNGKIYSTLGLGSIEINSVCVEDLLAEDWIVAKE
jgi:hypothetical protein